MKGKCLNLPINQLLYIFFIIFFHIYKNLSANYYPEHKERLQKEACQSIKIFLKKKKKKSSYMLMNIAKILQNMKSIKWMSIEKKYCKWEKTLFYNYKKVFYLRKFCFFIRKSIRKVFLLRLYLKRNKINFWFLDIASSLLKYKKFFKLGARKFHLWKCDKLFKSGFFLLFELEKLLLEKEEKYKARKLHFGRYSWNVRNVRKVSWNVWKSTRQLLLENVPS